MKERVKIMAQCDRCGKILEKHDRHHYRILKVYAQTSTWSPYHEEKCEHWYEIKHKLELCTECIDSFKHVYLQWLREGEKK